MGLSASQAQLLLITARRNDLEYRAQQISQRRLILSQQLEEIAVEYEDATANRQMKIALFLDGAADDMSAVNRTSNLTYASLVSGTISQFSSAQSGIQGYSRTEGQDYASTSAYRLVNADGAIVVSSEEEIPTSLTTLSESNAAPDVIHNENGDEVPNVFETSSKKISTNGEAAVSNKSKYVVAIGELANLFGDKEEEKAIKVDTELGYVSCEGKDGLVKYYSLADGTEYKNEAGESDIPEGFAGENATLVQTKNKIPQVKVTTSSESQLIKKEGNDGRFSLVNADGEVFARYVVDESLRFGSTDVNGTTDGPNYLQDCLRNGKYLLEKGTFNSQDGSVKWSSLSWDAAANITDSYYTEDDDKAKAKYDRLQNQIQAQDKKLELELDNIETQRKALTTEKESIDKVIDESTKSFNVFG